MIELTNWKGETIGEFPEDIMNPLEDEEKTNEIKAYSYRLAPIHGDTGDIIGYLIQEGDANGEKGETFEKNYIVTNRGEFWVTLIDTVVDRFIIHNDYKQTRLRFAIKNGCQKECVLVYDLNDELHALITHTAEVMTALKTLQFITSQERYFVI